MAEKKVELGIILRTVDKATAGIKAVNDKLDQLTKPTREFGKALKELGEKSGFNKVVEGFKGVGEASKEVFLHLLEGAAIIGEVTHLVLEMIEGFSTLNDTAERIGTSVDALAGLRYAASKSGSSIEKLDQGMTTFVENLGGVKAGTGKLTKFLGEVAPTMLTQLKATRTTEEALGILADGMEKLTNKSKLLKFAQEALGDPSLAALFHRGPKGIMELMAAYAAMAGPQQEAAERAAKVDDALKDLHAATDGVKAALVTGLSPAFTEIIDKLRVWLVGHREDIARWAEDLGRKLPGAVEDLVKAVQRVVSNVTGFVDAIGGWKVAAEALAATIAVQLVGSIVSLGVALATNPFGLIVLGAAAATLGVVGLVQATRGLYELMDSRNERLIADSAKLHAGTISPADFDARHPGVRAAQETQRAAEQELISGHITPEEFELKYPGQSKGVLTMAQLEGRGMFGTANPAALAPYNPFLSFAPQDVRIKVDFTNAPKGMRATVDAKSPNVDLTVGHQMGGSY